MYVTRPLSLYKKSPESLSALPPEGPNTGYLVIHDEESLPTCFGLSDSPTVNELPLPSNKFLKFGHVTHEEEILTVPVVNQPLSSNRYYVIKSKGKHKGEAYKCSKEEDKGISCGKSYILDEKPRYLAPDDLYQQFEFFPAMTWTNNNGFSAKSTAPDGYVPRFMRNSSTVKIKKLPVTSKYLTKVEAKGLDTSLRTQLPGFDFPLSRPYSEPVIVGKWLCPFMFVHDGKLQDQVNNSVYYEMTLEQYWERIFTADSGYSQGSKVTMDVVVPILVAIVGGKDAIIDELNYDNKVVWFRAIGSIGEGLNVGLSSLVVERMMWEQERVGWGSGKAKQVRIVREEEYGGIGWWAKFACYVLVERFVLKRMDGSLVLTCDFKHTHRIKTKWE